MAVPPEVAELIAGAVLPAHLATSVDDRPHVAPVWYGYEDGHVHVFTGGRKLANVRRNPRVAVSIERWADGEAEWSVLLRGTATLVDDPERSRAAVRRVFGKYLGPDEDAWPKTYRETLEDGPDVPLLDVAVGSASRQTY